MNLLSISGILRKKPRLQAKTLVCLWFGALPLQSYRVWCQISYRMDHEIPQACPEWADRWSGPRVDPGNLQVQGCWDHPRSCFCWWWQALVGFSLFSKLPPQAVVVRLQIPTLYRVNLAADGHQPSRGWLPKIRVCGKKLCTDTSSCYNFGL